MKSASACPPPARWRDYIDDRLPPADDAVLTRHIQACRACERALAALIAPLNPPVTPDRPPHAPAELVERLRRLWCAEPEPGDAGAAWPELPGYEIVGVLGTGGMGVVYRARQLDLGREVAVKMLAPRGPVSAPDARRLLTDAATAAKLVHPHVVSVFDVGEYRGKPFFVMELVSGGSLAQHLPALVESPREAARLIAQAARALDYAHHRGVCHRDVKPANIMLRPRHLPGLRPDPDRPPPVANCDSCVTDFGLAKRTNGDTGLTLDGAVVGTPGYIAPEQIRAEKPAPAADVFGLGAVLYECLTGQPPFRGATPFDALLLTLQREPVRPRALNYRLPRDLETVCLKALEKEPGRRYPSAAALADDLERWLRGEPVRARPIGPLARGWRWCRRKPLVPGFVAALALAVAGGLLASVWMWRKAADNEARAVASLRNEEAARRDAEEQFAMLRATMTSSVAGSAPEFRSEQFHARRLLMLEEADGSLVRLLERQPGDAQLRAIRARVLTQLGTIHFTQGRAPEAVAAFEGAVALWEGLGDDPERHRHRNWRAITYVCLEQAYERSGREAEAQQRFETALRLWRDMIRDEPLLGDNLFPAAVNMGWLLIGDAAPEASVPQRFQKLRERLARACGADEAAFLFGLLRLEYLYFRVEGDIRQGHREHIPAVAREAAAFLTATLARPAENRAYLAYAIRQSHKVCLWLRRAGLPGEALALADRATRAAQWLLQEAPNEPARVAQLSDSWHAVSKAHSDLNHAEEAIGASRNALAAHQRLFALAPGDENVRAVLGSRHLQLARKLCTQGRLDAAEGCFAEREALWPGDAGKREEALRELQKWTVQARDELQTTGAQEKFQRLLELHRRLENKRLPGQNVPE